MNKLHLNEAVYSLKSINETCDVYKEYAQIRMIQENSHIELIFDRCKYDPKLTMKEFENYLINVENSKR